MPSYCHSFCLPPVWRGSGENPHHPNENEFGRAAVCVCGSRAKIDSVRGGRRFSGGEQDGVVQSQKGERTSVFLYMNSQVAASHCHSLMKLI